MYFKVSYDSDFDELMMHLKTKYGMKLFDLDGIGKQLDMDAFSKQFFTNTTATADVSVDANANVDAKDVIAYNFELPKPFMRYNSYYVLWKKLRQLYGHAEANRIIEAQLTGDIYINDFGDIGRPYSYFGKTCLTIQTNEKRIENLPIDALFDRYKDDVQILSDRETIDLTRYNIDILDENNVFVQLKVVLRHHTDKDLIKFETKRGECTIVTEDHPVIMSDMSEKKAGDVTLSDELAQSPSAPFLTERINIPTQKAYLMGFVIGDGYSDTPKKTSGYFVCVQNNPSECKAFKCASELYENCRLDERRPNRFKFGSFEDIQEWNIGVGAYNKKLPSEIIEWKRESILSLIAGLIDSDGSVNKKTGVVDIRTASFTMIQQTAELLRSLRSFNRIRTSFVKGHDKNREGSFRSNYDMYRVSFSLLGNEDCFYLSDESTKISKAGDICFKDRGRDGRWDSPKLHCIERKADVKEEWVYDVTTETGTFCSQGLIQHNCFNFSVYDIMLHGLPMIKKIKSVPPKYLYALKSQVEQFVVIAANSTLGATGLADLLIVMSHYVKRLLETKSDAHFKLATKADCWSYVRENIASLIYTINQPMRGNQSPFTNISVFDRAFLETLCTDAYHDPRTGETPDLDMVMKIQELFLDVMNDELSRTPVTFPITTACFCVDENDDIMDDDFVKMIAEKNRDFGFINIYCGKTSTLSSCCRLRSDVSNEYFNSFGSGSSKIGSLGVVTMNLPRMAVKAVGQSAQDRYQAFLTILEETVVTVGKINNAKRHIIKRRIDNGNLPLYDFGIMELSKQYSTAGVNGINEALEILGLDILDEEGQKFVLDSLHVINSTNDKLQRQYKSPHNCEQTPSENSSIKLANKDTLTGYNPDGYPLYSNQFIPLTTKADMLDRIRLQGMFDKHFSGGAILHVNVGQRIEDPADIEELIRVCAKMGVVYWAVNYHLQRCENDHMSIGTNGKCGICGGKIIDHFTRVVGFLTATKNWHKVRREVDHPHRQFYGSLKGEHVGEIEYQEAG